MSGPPSATDVLPEARRILALARRDEREAERALAALPLPVQVAIVCEAPAAQRAKLLGLLPEPEAAIPLVPDAELVFAVKASGLDDASWLLASATARQIATCFDLDAWKGLTPDRASLGEWFAVLAAAGEEALLRGAHAIDAEVLALFLRSHIEVALDPKDEHWQAPPGAQTLEGQFYFWAKHEGDDLEAVAALLDALFREDYWLYFRMMQAVIWELETELEEWALRWRAGRLADLGFPEWEDAIRIYGFLRPEQRSVLADRPHELSINEWDLPVWIPSLPALAGGSHAIFRAAFELSVDARRAFFYAFVALANKIAVADGLALGDVETLPRSIEKAARFASLGLEHAAKCNATTLADALSRSTVEHLFRVGANLDPEASRPARGNDEDLGDDR